MSGIELNFFKMNNLPEGENLQANSVYFITKTPATFSIYVTDINVNVTAHHFPGLLPDQINDLFQDIDTSNWKEDEEGTIKPKDGKKVDASYIKNLLDLRGSNYVFVQANATDQKNAQELQKAYNTAKTKVEITSTPGENIIDTLFFGSTQTINTGSNYFMYFDFLSEPFPLGVQNVEVVSDEFTGIIEIDVGYSNDLELGFNYSGITLTNVTSFKFFVLKAKKATVIAAPGYYNFSSDFVMDEEYVDLVSLDGNRSIIFNGDGSININSNNVFVKGVDVQNKSFKIGDDLNLLKVENCKGGNYSFNSTSSGKISGVFINCEGGDNSFGSNEKENASGEFINCEGGDRSFGSGAFGIASGNFTNCVGGERSFGSGSYGVASGIFINCRGRGIYNGFGSFGGGFRATASGIFTNCIAGNNSFGGSAGTLSGKLYYCRVTQGGFINVSGTGLTRLCVAGNNEVNNQG